MRALTEGRGADFAFDCVGSAGTIRGMWSATRRGGSCTVVGIGGKDETVVTGYATLAGVDRALDELAGARAIRTLVRPGEDAA